MSTSTIINVISEHTCDKCVQTPVLISKRIVPTCIELRLRTTCYRTVFQTWTIGGFACTITIFIKNVVLRASIYSSCILICIESTNRFALHNSLCPTICRNTSYHWVSLGEISSMECLILHLIDSILVMREVEGSTPHEILGTNRHRIQCKLNTLIGHLTHIGIHPTIYVLSC